MVGRRSAAARRGVPLSIVVGTLLVACSSGATPTAAVSAPASPSPVASVVAPVRTPARVSALPPPPASRSSVGTALPASPRTSSSAPAPTNGVAFVDVAVATLWHRPTSPRGVDAAALTSPVGVRGWLAAMTTTQRRELNGLVDSQLLLGERVVVDQVQGGWAHVVVPDQPTPLDARGYPGWIPLAQLTFRAAQLTATDAVVVSPTAWVYAVDGSRLFEVSHGDQTASGACRC